MNLNKLQHRNETENLLLSITKNSETLFKQTHRKAEETLEFKLTKPREMCHFNPPISIGRSWMIDLTSLEVYNSIFSISELQNIFEVYTYTFADFSFIKLKDELEEILSISDITPYHLQQEKIGPRNTETFEKLGLEKSTIDGYTLLILGYARPLFRNLESYLRTVVGLDEDDVQLILKQYKSNFVTYEIVPGVSSTKDFSEAVYTMGDHDGTLKNEYDDTSMKTKLVLTRFGNTFGTFRFVEKSFLSTLLGFTPF